MNHNCTSLVICLVYGSLIFMFSCVSAKIFPSNLVEVQAIIPEIKPWPIERSYTPKLGLITHFYGNMSYPTISQEAKTMGTYRAEYIVGTNGMVTFANAVLVGKPTFVNNIESDTIEILGYIVPMIEQSHGTYLPPPTKVITSAMEEEGRNAILAEIKRAVELLPRFKPAQRHGRNVAVRMSTTFIYRLE